jgi:hypothetical protein
MSRKDGAGKSKEGSGRVAMFRASKNTMPHCYTLECNYHSGSRTNILFPLNGNVNVDESKPIPLKDSIQQEN